MFEAVLNCRPGVANKPIVMQRLQKKVLEVEMFEPLRLCRLIVWVA